MGGLPGLPIITPTSLGSHSAWLHGCWPLVLGRRCLQLGGCKSGGGKGPLANAKEIVDKNTNTIITKDAILRSRRRNLSQPTSGSMCPRPKVEKRPETSSKSFWSVITFDGATPETINLPIGAGNWFLHLFSQTCMSNETVAFWALDYSQDVIHHPSTIDPI